MRQAQAHASIWRPQNKGAPCLQMPIITYLWVQTVHGLGQDVHALHDLEVPFFPFSFFLVLLYLN